MANNLRVCWDNALERATSFSASSTAGLLAASNLITTDKSEIWRATGTTARLSALWATAEIIQAVALPFSNLSPTATMRVRITNEAQATNLVPASEDFGNACWVPYWTAPAKTTGVASPDGGLRATRLASADASGSANNAESGLVCNTTVSASGRVTASIWARVTSGTLNVTFGVNDSEQASYTLTTTWQRLVYTSSASLTIASGARVLQIHEATLGNAAWEIFGAQSEVGTSASSYYPTTGAPAQRPLGYIDTWQSYDYDSGWVLACPAPAVKLRGFTAAQAASAYAYGGGAYARHWMPAPKAAVGLAVDIADPNNLQGAPEAACMVAGPVWAPAHRLSGASNVTMTNTDTTSIYRTDSGSQRADAGYTYRTLPIDVSLVAAQDRADFVSILRNSRAYPILVSVSTGVADLALERDNLVYGRRAKDSDVAMQYALAYSTTIPIEEI
jgi:hypothetical protein